MNSLEPGSHILAKKTAYLFDKDFNFADFSLERKLEPFVDYSTFVFRS